MKNWKDDFTTVELAIVIICMWIISFCVGFTIPDAVKVITANEASNSYSLITAQYYEPIPDAILDQFYEDGGTVTFESRNEWKGEKWSVGYYQYPFNDIHVCWDIGKLDSYEQILAHEMAHYLYFTDENFDYDKWNYIAEKEKTNSQYYGVTASGKHYYADVKELFAQQCSLYMRAMDNTHYEADRDAAIMWIFEKAQCPECCKFIENYFSVYYN